MSLPRLSLSIRSAETLLNRAPTARLALPRRSITQSATSRQQQQQPPRPATSSNVNPPTTPNPTSPTPSPAQDRASRIISPTPSHQTTGNISKTGLSDKPLELDVSTEEKIDWTRSFHGLSAEPFPKEAADVLLAPTDPAEVEIKPDGILYLPEIKYRRILNRAFGPGGWGLVPRSESIVTPKTVTREYALVCNGRLVSVARGEQDYFTPDGIPTATEGCRSNALVRCCKDLGIASELWDPRFIRKFKAEHTREAFVEHIMNKKKSKIWLRKDDQVSYPWKEMNSR
ncbi:hypothetical protein N8T08_004919 [Aspergillus melleus]|uniref:Uncharacterized protein n=1 Tax=Aspergillus melleus TaxID=138277 RepID=A0ACC3B363_9EURO|nr:hypothetical protein N8T08_004919 [Aspergillus melleus]